MQACEKHTDDALKMLGKAAKSVGVEVILPDRCSFCRAEKLMSSDGDHDFLVKKAKEFMEAEEAKEEEG